MIIGISVKNKKQVMLTTIITDEIYPYGNNCLKTHLMNIGAWIIGIIGKFTGTYLFLTLDFLINHKLSRCIGIYNNFSLLTIHPFLTFSLPINIDRFSLPRFKLFVTISSQRIKVIDELPISITLIRNIFIIEVLLTWFYCKQKHFL